MYKEKEMEVRSREVCFVLLIVASLALRKGESCPMKKGVFLLE